MTGDYTKVPLRHDERWESAPNQEGRALLDHELNLDAAASIRRDQNLAADAIGPAGVIEGSPAFAITLTGGGSDLQVGQGRMWVDGLAALAPTGFNYGDQDQIDPLPAAGRALIYLDVWEEHVHPSEDPAILDPALAPIDTAARTRVGYRVRFVTTTATTCQGAWNGFNPAPLSTGRLTVTRIGPAQPLDPCDPPGDTQGLMPDGLLRIEVLDQGAAAGARFAWSYENGSAAVPIAAIAADTVTLQPSASVKFGNDLVEISWLARRAERRNAGGLYTITNVTSLATGDVLTLDRPVTAPAGAEGLVARRWDGQVIGAAVDRNASRGGNDLGVRFRAGPGNFRPGDWWGIRVRQANGVEPLNGATPDGTRHRYAPLALVDFDAGTVLSDCRPTFRPLTDIETGSPCTVVVRPGDSLQTAVDSLPAGGGEVCLSAGTFTVPSPVVVANRSRVRITGVGPATEVSSTSNETVFRFTDSDEVEITGMTVRSSGSTTIPGNPALNGALTFEGCRGVDVRMMRLVVPDGPMRSQTGITVRERGRRTPERVTIVDNHLTVGAWQTAILVTEVEDLTVERNHVMLGPDPAGLVVPSGDSVFALELAKVFSASIGRNGVSRTVRLPTGASVQLLVASPVATLVDEWVRIGSPRSGTPEQGFRNFLRGTTRNGGANLNPDGLNAYRRLARNYRSIGQGIVVGGRQSNRVRITGNTVRDAVQGLHLGARLTSGRSRIVQAVITENTTHLRVPASYSRERHSLFVGNVDSLEISHARSTMSRTVNATAMARTAVDAIRLIGTFGPFITVRGAHSEGFEVGVRAVPVGTVPTRRVWTVRDVVAAGLAGSVGASVPTQFLRDQVVP